jgi:hypothetical protein
MAEKCEAGFKTNPDYRITFERSPRRVRIGANGAENTRHACRQPAPARAARSVSPRAINSG